MYSHSAECIAGRAAVLQSQHEATCPAEVLHPVKLLLRLLAVLLLAVACCAVWLLLAPYGPRAETFVDIPTGTPTAQIAARLQHGGVLRSRFAFDVLRPVLKGRLKAGEYRFDHPETPVEVYRRIARGDVFTVTLVIPEGYDLFEIAAAVQHAGLGSAQAFLDGAHRNPALIRAYSPHATTLEGYLFPDTYSFQRKATPLQMQNRMVERFTQVAQQLGLAARPTHRKPNTASKAGTSGKASTQAAASDRLAQPSVQPASQPAAQTPVDIAQLVTLASLVEREVAQPAERSLVASVFDNRLTAGMPLATDPSVAYAAMLEGRWRGTIYQSDLQSDSPYNTYRRTGLPPGPICSPGFASLQAVLHPAKTPYLYFVADAHGHSRFSTTLAEHNRNVALYRQAIR
jgi:UPF0755 protein